jgi:hypothetical protein
VSYGEVLLGRLRLQLADADHFESTRCLEGEVIESAFAKPIGVGLRLHLNVTPEHDDFASLIRTIPGTDASLNSSRTSRLGVRNESSSRTKQSDC